jgi:hypothetical protein
MRISLADCNKSAKLLILSYDMVFMLDGKPIEGVLMADEENGVIEYWIDSKDATEEERKEAFAHDTHCKRRSTGTVQIVIKD